MPEQMLSRKTLQFQFANTQLISFMLPYHLATYKVLANCKVLPPLQAQGLTSWCPESHFKMRQFL
jgi:hypothetical protein